MLKYSTFGPMIFTKKDGSIADFGKLCFTSTYRTAYFVRVSDTTSAATLALLAAAGARKEIAAAEGSIEALLLALQAGSRSPHDLHMFSM